MLKKRKKCLAMLCAISKLTQKEICQSAYISHEAMNLSEVQDISEGFQATTVSDLNNHSAEGEFLTSVIFFK